MGKGHWNRKRVYSIRKFAVGACSVMIGTCAVLFGGSVIGESPVFADETPIARTVEQAKDESPAVEEKEDQAVAEHKDVTSVDQSQAAPIEVSQRRKKMNL